MSQEKLEVPITVDVQDLLKKAKKLKAMPVPPDDPDRLMKRVETLISSNKQFEEEKTKHKFQAVCVFAAAIFMILLPTGAYYQIYEIKRSLAQQYCQCPPSVSNRTVPSRKNANQEQDIRKQAMHNSRSDNPNSGALIPKAVDKCTTDSMSPQCRSTEEYHSDKDGPPNILSPAGGKKIN